MTDKIWDVELVAREGEPALRARVKRMTMRDGLQKAQLERELTTRSDNSPDKDIEMLYIIQHYPLIKFGLAEVEGVKLPLTEEAFWNLPEQFVVLTAEKIREVNPQYDVPFLALMAMHGMNFQSTPETEPTSTSKSEQPDRLPLNESSSATTSDEPQP